MIGNYFGTDDYLALSAEEKVIVDKWLEAKNALNRVSLVQEIDGGERLVLSGPDEDESDGLSEYDLVPIVILDENDFPWKVLKKNSQ